MRLRLSNPRVVVARLPIHFLVVAVTFFSLGATALPWVVRDLTRSFYQPTVLALVHTFTLGWITGSIMGVMTRYVPSLTKRNLPFPRLAQTQFVLFVIGAGGLVAHFFLGRWGDTALAAATMWASIVLFAVNMTACLLPVWHRGATETGLLLSLGFLFLSAGFGLLLALDKTFGFLGGSLLGNLAAHVHLAALGWAGLTICAVSYRLVPAFLLPASTISPLFARGQVYALAASIALLSLSLLGRIGGVRLWSLLVAASLLSHTWILSRVFRRRRMPIDWAMRHAAAGIGCLMFAMSLGLALAWVGAGTGVLNRVAGAYGAVGLLGWMTNFIVGMSYHLVPGFVVGARSAAGLPLLSLAELSPPRARAFVFFSLNLGLLVLAAGLLAGEAWIASAAATVFAIGGLRYALASAQTLSFAWRRRSPS